jgi:hypothetical protein
MKFPFEIKLITAKGVVVLNQFGRATSIEDLVAHFVH